MNRLCFFLAVLFMFPSWSLAQFEYRSNWRTPPTTFKPYVIKLTTPNGINILRDIPLDHLHHHGLMFAIKIDDVNFWEEFNPVDYGRQETNTITQTAADVNAGTPQKVESTITWANGIGQPLALEKRTITAAVVDGATVLDWTSVFTLPTGKDKAVLGGNQYHGLGMRFVQSMDVGTYFFPSDAGAKTENSTPCRWIGYTAKVGDKPVTVALFDTKENPRPMYAFQMWGNYFAYISATVNLHKEPITLTSEKPITFRYKIALWDGEKTTEDVEKVNVE